MTIREARAADLDGLLALYAQLHSDDALEPDSPLRALWRRILEDDNYHIIVAERDGRPVSSCTCVVIPNLTHHQRPYALIENVVTDAPFRGPPPVSTTPGSWPGRRAATSSP